MTRLPVVRVIRSEGGYQYVDVGSQASAASSMDLLLVPSISRTNPPLLGDTGSAFNTPTDRGRLLLSRNAKPSSIIRVRVVRSFAASALARASSSSLRFKVVFMQVIVQKSVWADKITEEKQPPVCLHPLTWD